MVARNSTVAKRNSLRSRTQSRACWTIWWALAIVCFPLSTAKMLRPCRRSSSAL